MPHISHAPMEPLCSLLSSQCRLSPECLLPAAITQPPHLLHMTRRAGRFQVLHGFACGSWLEHISQEITSEISPAQTLRLAGATECPP